MTKPVSKLARAPEKSPLQQRAEAEAVQFRRAVYEYRDLLPANHERNPTKRGDVCRADGWSISQDWLDGDYDLDDAVAHKLIDMLIEADPVDAESSWLHEYFNGKTDGLASEIKNAAVGPGSILGNVNKAAEAKYASVRDKTAKAIQVAVGDVANKRMKSIKINDYMTVYNGNTSGKGRPRPKLKITGMPIQVVTPALGARVTSMATGAYNGKLLVKEALEEQIKNLAQVTADRHMSRFSFRGSSMSGKVGGHFLTFGVSGVIDVVQSIDRDVDGRLGFNGRRFAVASARSQSGNVAGVVGGFLFSVGAVAFTSLALVSAPVIIFGLAGGIFFQAVWGASGGTDWAGAAMEQYLGD